MSLSRIYATAALSMAVLAGPIALATNASAQNFPQKNIEIIVHTGAGGPLDALARSTAELLNKELGWSVRVENRPGGNGEVALARTRLQPADGYTIQGVTSALSNNFALGRSQIKLTDIEYLMTVQGEPSALVVRSDSPLKTVNDYVDALKKKSNSLRVGGSGQGGNDFVQFQLDGRAGLKTTWIPFDTAPEAVVALAGGHIDAAFLSVSSALPQIKAGSFRVLAVSSAQRVPEMPEVPTMKEAGYDVQFVLWRGFIVKAGTPPEVTAAIKAGLTRIQQTEAWKTMMKTQQQEYFVLDSAAFAALVARESEDLHVYYKANGLVQ